MDVEARLTSPETAAVQRRRGWSLKRIAGLTIGLGIVLSLLFAGVSIRKWTYEHTQPIRHFYDIHNNLYYGGRAVDEGVLNVYGNVRNESYGGNYGLDYVPLRLLVMREWAAWARSTYGPDTQWQEDYAFTRPLLYFNAAMEAAAALAVFLLVRLWIRRADASPYSGGGSVPLVEAQPPPRPWRGCVAGFVGAMLLWFSPAAQISAHAWPSWDIWVVPFYLYAVLLGCVEWWFCAGVVLGIGTMFKGQQLMVAPLFVMWPLFMGRWTAPLRWLAGYAFAGAIIVSPWLLRDGTTRELDARALTWVLCVAGACVMLVAATGFFKRKWYGWAIRLPAAGLMAWPWLSRYDQTGHGWMAGVLAGVAVALAGLLPLRRQACLAAAAVAATLILCPVLFSGDMSWWDVSFRYGSEKFDWVQQLGADTLPALLGARFNWSSFREVVFSIEPGLLWRWPTERVDFDLGKVLVGAYGIGLTLSALGMALQTRRKDRHFLAAMAAPWLLAFVLMPRMHSRYLLFAACVGAVLAGIGMGGVLLDILLIVLAWGMTLHLMFGNYYGHAGQNPPLEGYVPSGWAAPVERGIYLTNPDMAWGLLLVTAILLYLGLARSRSRAHPVAA